MVSLVKILTTVYIVVMWCSQSPWLAMVVWFGYRHVPPICGESNEKMYLTAVILWWWWAECNLGPCIAYDGVIFSTNGATDMRTEVQIESYMMYTGKILSTVPSGQNSAWGAPLLTIYIRLISQWHMEEWCGYLTHMWQIYCIWIWSLVWNPLI